LRHTGRNQGAITMRTTGLIVAIGMALLLAAPSARAQGKVQLPPAQSADPNPVFNGGPPSRDTAPPANVPTNPPFNSPMNDAPPGSATPPQAPSSSQISEPQVRWNSAAAVVWRNRNGRALVAIGYSGTQPTEAAARASAIQACRSAGGGSGCKAIGAWNSGCLYIAAGSSSSRAAWGSGADVDAALKKCRSERVTCKQPIGGCVD
jgi:hypothetical protein